MGTAYPELKANEILISETLEFEENKFRETLGRGLKILNDEIEGVGDSKIFSGEVAFKLYDTFGFPLDLTEDLLKSKNIKVDKKKFNQSMDKQKKQTKSSWKGSGEKSNNKFDFELIAKYPSTNFFGYDTSETECELLSIVCDGKEVKRIEPNEEAILITDQSVFYAESGGQVADTGEMTNMKNGIKFYVKDVQKIGGSLFCHRGSLAPDSKALSIGQKLDQNIDQKSRKNISKNHSATHILHEALRQVLGEHISQKGSLVDGNRLRFDFSHQKVITEEEILDIEKLANNIVMQNNPVETEIMTIEDAINSGARALFGEKYGKEVRVVSMGEIDNQKFSIELCGGIHAKSTGDIGLIKVMSEQGIASGVRRIEAITGENAINFLTSQNTRMQRTQELLNAQGDDVIEKLEAILKEKRHAERELENIKKKDKFQNIGDKLDEISVGEITLIYQNLDDVSTKELRQLMDETKAKVKSAIIVLIGNQDGKIMIIVGITEDVLGKYSANDIIKIIAKFSDIKGGGRDDMAQAGGSQLGKKSEIIDAISKYIGSS